MRKANRDVLASKDQTHKATWREPMDKLARILLSAILVTNLFPVIPVAADEKPQDTPAPQSQEEPVPQEQPAPRSTLNEDQEQGSGEGQGEGQGSGEGQGEGQGSGEGKGQAQDYQGQGSEAEQSKGLEDGQGQDADNVPMKARGGDQGVENPQQKVTPQVTATITEYTSADGGWTDGNGTYAGGDAKATVLLTGTFDENTENSVEVTVTGPKCSTTVTLESTNSPVPVDVLLPQSDDKDNTYTFANDKSDITIAYDNKILNAVPGENVLPTITVKQPYNVTATISYSPENATFANEATASATIRAEAGFTTAVQAKLAYKIGNGDKQETSEVTLNSDGTPVELNNFATLSASEGELSSITVTGIEYSCDEFSSERVSQNITNSNLSLNRVATVTGASISYDGGKDTTGGYEAYSAVTAIITIDAENIAEGHLGGVAIKVDGSEQAVLEYNNGVLTATVNLPFDLGKTYSDDSIQVYNPKSHEWICPTDSKSISFKVDNTPPIVNNPEYKNASGDAMTPCEPNPSTYSYYDIQDNLHFIVSATDDESGVANGTASVAWTATGGNIVDGPAIVDSNEAADIIELVFSAENFYSERDDFIIPTITYTFVDRSNNSWEGQSVSFGCDSYAFTVWPYELMVAKPDGVKKATRLGNDVYNANVQVSFVSVEGSETPTGTYDFASSKIDVTGGSLLVAKELETGMYSAMTSQETANNQYSVSAMLKTNHGATRNYSLPDFYVDTTAPSVTWTQESTDGSAVNKDESGILYYKKNQVPKVTITVSDASTLNVAGQHGLTVKLLKEGVESQDLSEGLSWTQKTTADNNSYYEGSIVFDDTLPPLESGKRYQLILDGTNIFGVSLETSTSSEFLEDKGDPKVWANFSGPVNLASIIAGDEVNPPVASFYKDWSKTEDNVGSVTLYVQDPLIKVEDNGTSGYTLTDVTITEPATLQNADTAGKWKKVVANNEVAYTLTLPYVKDGETLVIGEGIGKSLQFSATDIAGNVGDYKYASKETVINGSEWNETTHADTFAIDVTKPVFVGAETTSLGTQIPAEKTQIGKSVTAFKTSNVEFTIRVNELNFDTTSSKIFYQKYVNGHKQGESTQFEVETWSYAKGGINTATIALAELENDAHQEVVYQLCYELFDTPGNSTGYIETENYYAFDTSGPEIRVNLDAEPIARNNVDYYDSRGVTATVQVRDAFFSAGTVTYKDSDGTTDQTENAFTLKTDEDAIDSYYEAIVVLPESSIGVQYSASDFKVEATDQLNQSADWTYASDVYAGDPLTEKQTSSQFVVDGTAPTVTIAFEDSPSVVSSSTDIDYYDETSMTAIIVIDDIRFDPENSRLSDNGLGQETSFSAITSPAPIVEGSKHTYKVTYSAGAIKHTIGVMAKDGMPNPHTTRKSYKNRTEAPENSIIDRFVLDNVGVAIQGVSFDNAPLNNASINDRDYFANELQVTIMASGANFVNTSPITAGNGSINGDSWTDADGKWMRTISYLDTPANQQATLSFEVWDELYANSTDEKKAELRAEKKHYKDWKYIDGQRNIANSTEPYSNTNATSFIVDTQAPKVDVSFSLKGEAQNGIDYYKDKAIATITVTDNNITSEALDSLNLGGEDVNPSTPWTQNGAVWTRKVKYTDEKLYQPEAVSIKDIIYGITSDNQIKNAHSTSYSYGINEGNCTTKADGQTVVGPKFCIDYTDPIVDFMIDQHYVGTISNTRIDYLDTAKECQAIATVTVTDLSFNPKSVDWSTVEMAGVAVQDKNSETNGWAQDPSDAKVWRATIVFTENAVDVAYVPTFSVKDYATRSTNYKYGRTDKQGDKEKTSTWAGRTTNERTKLSGTAFVIDVTKPTITVTFDQSVMGTTNDTDYYSSKNTIQARVTVRDRNFDPNLENSGIEPTGKAWKYLDTEWNQDGEKWYRDIEFSENAYGDSSSLSVKVQDKVVTAADGDSTKLVQEVDHKASWNYGKDPRGESESQIPASASKFVIDATGPSVNVTLDKNPVQNDGETNTDYFDGEVTATIVVADHNLDKESLASFEAPYIKSGFALDDWKDNGDGTYTTHVKFSQTLAGRTYDICTKDGSAGVCDMVYKVAAAKPSGHNQTYTYAQNESDKVTTKDIAGRALYGSHFFVDLDTPRVDVVINQHYAGTIDGVDYYDTLSDGAIRATITVTDSAFRPTSSQIPGMQNGTIVQWQQTNSDTWVATVDYPETQVNTLYDLGAITAKDWVNRTNTYKYGDNQSSDTIKSTKAGRNDSEMVAVNGESFVADATQPEIAVSFGNEQNPNGVYPVNNAEHVMNDCDYYNMQSLVATVQVIDNNFDEKNTRVTFGDGIEGSQSEGWERTGNVWTSRFVFNEHEVGRRSTLNVYTQDLVKRAHDETQGSTLVEEAKHVDGWDYSGDGVDGTRNGAAPTGAHYFVLDATGPTIDVRFDRAPQQVAYRGTGVDYYAGVPGDNIEATITVHDRNFDPNTDLSRILPIGNYGTVTQAWQQTPGTDEWTAKVEFIENVNASTSDLQITAQDFLHTAGAASGASFDGHNASYDYGQSNTVAGDNGGPMGEVFIFDCSAPIVQSVNGVNNFSGIYATDITGSQDEGSYLEPLLFYNSEGAGIIVDEVDNNGLEAASVDQPFELEGVTNPIDNLTNSNTVRLLQPESYDNRRELDFNTKLKLTDHANNYAIWSVSPTGKVFLVAQGNEGDKANTFVNDLEHPNTHPQKMVLDTTAPVLSWATSVQEGAYYNTTQSITMNIEEMNFDYLQQYDGGQTVITVSEYAGSAGRALTEWTRSVSNFGGGGTSYSHTLDFDHDGHYALVGKLTDPANNSSQIEFKEFTIDKTAPKILSITYDNNDVRNGKYYKAVRTATITVEEHNWDDGAQGSFVKSNGSIGGWSHNGDIHVCNVYYGTDGDYNLSVSITDRAGNSVSQTEPEFTIDLIAPKIEFRSVEDKHAYGDTIAPNIEFRDEKNFDSAGIHWTLKGNKNGTKNFSTSTTPNGNGSTVAYSDLDRVVESDDIYTLDANMTDLAGNEAKGSIMFSVNRFGSNFMVRNAEQYEVNGGFLATAPKVQIDEINVTGSEQNDHGVTVTQGLDTKTLKLKGSKNDESDGFYIDSGLESYGWAHYTYHVGKGNYKSDLNNEEYDDGNYYVTVVSKDKSDPQNTNNSANYYNPETHSAGNAEVNFMLDTTAPIVENMRVDEGGLFSPIAKVTFTAMDNIALDNVTYEANGNTQSMKQGTTSEYSIEVPEHLFVDTKVSVVAKDRAGNYSDGRVEGNSSAAPNTVLLNSGTIMVRAGIWRYLPLIAVIAAVVAVAILFIAKRRGSDDATQSDGEGNLE